MYNGKAQVHKDTTKVVEKEDPAKTALKKVKAVAAVYGTVGAFKKLAKKKPLVPIDFKLAE